MSLSTHSDVYTGKPSYYHGNNGLVVNGTVPGYGHGNNSDNNFNKIRQTHSTDNMMNPSGYLPSSLHSLGPPPPPLCHLPPTSTSPTAHHPPHHHHPSYPPSPTTSPHPHGRRRRQNHSGGGSHSEEQDSAEELEQQQPLMRGEVQGQAGEPPTYFCAPGNNNNNNRGCRGVGDSLDNGHHHQHHHHHHPPHHPHPHRPGYGYPPASSSSGVLYPSSSKDGRGEEGRAEWGGEEGVWHPWSGPSPHVTSSSGQHGGRHKRRRRRGQGGGGDRGEREHSVRDQATNTDLSSNGEEGTAEGITCSQSPAGSLSNGSDNSGHSDPADVTTVTLPDRTSADRLLCAVTVPPVGSL
ncbi:uncharacterized protein LOC143291771 [Babylonia areolata]|uniref:uncharacterized protein LOC143291771 n=1 Tax=Babylonia areolata TaxID=304850 RepID=UPI003FCF0879